MLGNKNWGGEGSRGALHKNCFGWFLFVNVKKVHGKQEIKKKVRGAFFGGGQCFVVFFLALSFFLGSARSLSLSFSRSLSFSKALSCFFEAMPFVQSARGKIKIKKE